MQYKINQHKNILKQNLIQVNVCQKINGVHKYNRTITVITGLYNDTQKYYTLTLNVK